MATRAGKVLEGVDDEAGGGEGEKDTRKRKGDGVEAYLEKIKREGKRESGKGNQ